MNAAHAVRLGQLRPRGRSRVLAPEITTWVGSLSLATWHTSPCAASAASFSRRLLADAEQRRHGALPDRHGRLHGLAARSSAGARHRRRLSAPAAASAEYSPSEWPATNLTLSASAKPLLVSSTRITASETAISAGWAFSVSVSVSSGPSHMTRRASGPAPRRPPRTRRGPRREALASSAPMPTAWLPCPGNTNAMAIGVDLVQPCPCLSSGLATVRPALSRLGRTAPRRGNLPCRYR